MKEVKTEYQVTQYHTEYEAVDGTKFDTRENCEKYEKGAEAVILARLKDIEINRVESEDSIFPNGSDEAEVRIVIPRSSKDIDNLNILASMYGYKNAETLPFSKKDIGFPVCISLRFCSNNIDWLWFTKLSTVIKDATNGTFELKEVKNG